MASRRMKIFLSLMVTIVCSFLAVKMVSVFVDIHEAGKSENENLKLTYETLSLNDMSRMEKLMGRAAGIKARLARYKTTSQEVDEEVYEALYEELEEVYAELDRLSAKARQKKTQEIDDNEK